VAINYDEIMRMEDLGREFSYDDSKVILYALAAGMGRDPQNERELRFVFEEEGFAALPTLAVVVSRGPLSRLLPIDRTQMLHGEQSLTLYRELPTSGTFTADSRITNVIDKGLGRGALIYLTTTARDLEGEAVFAAVQVLFARGDGGFGGPSGPSAPRHAVPDYAPDHVLDTQTRTEQALLYRLTGDRNPLHADPNAARLAGFPVPILHGLCTYAIACRAVVAAVCDYNPARIGKFDVRFTSPVYPGECIRTEIWEVGSFAHFRCRVEERNVTVIDNGYCELKGC
jgi:acyl dehydratase